MTKRQLPFLPPNLEATVKSWFDGVFAKPQLAFLQLSNDSIALAGLRGAELAMQRYNAVRGANQVSLQVLTDVDQLKKNSQVVGLVGPQTSSEVMQIGPELNILGLPFITPSATTSSLSQQNWPTFHRMLANDTSQAEVIATKILNDGRQRVVVLDDGGTYGQALASAVLELLGSKGLKADNGSQVMSLRPDAIFIGASNPETTTNLLQSLPRVPLYFSDALRIPEFLELAGARLEGAVFSSPALPMLANPDFANLYMATYGVEPPMFAAESYDATNALLAGISQGVKNRKQMQDFLKDVNAQGVSGDISWDTTGEISRDDVYLYQVKNGEFEVL